MEENRVKLPELRIGKLVTKVPIIQGGMAIRLSTARLAAAVANEGGIGLIAASGMPFDELRHEIKLARKLSPRGIIGINVMVAAREFKGLVTTAIEEGIDLVVAGAGFSRDMFAWGKDSGTPIVPIVSSAKLAKISQSLGASAVVVEGAEAGGHLGTNRSSASSYRRYGPLLTSLSSAPAASCMEAILQKCSVSEPTASKWAADLQPVSNQTALTL